ncbi:hypothetical protein [Rhodovibrio salinarum]|uniref:Uncharacterized protein n=1 Tax=Rhodovibrio salinarum TaxID=1087 RepID=A0A934V190_9PROT|nr:hypothetical protein [Rhodovibrio salinarum]MBK1698563.1 hypothetical protein [Rhodovibrio salinarum]
MAKQDTNMRALKGLVIGMGVLIAVGLTVVVVTIAMRLTGPESAEETAAPAGGSGMTPRPASAAGTQAFGDLNLDMAASCRIVDAVPSGGTLAIRLDGPSQDGCDQLVVVDPVAGQVLGRIRPGGKREDAQ